MTNLCKGLVVNIIEPVGGHGGMDYYDYGLALGLGNDNVKVNLFTCNSTKERFYSNVTTIYSFGNIWKKGLLLKSILYIIGHIKAFVYINKYEEKIVHLHFFTFRSIDLLVLILGKLFSNKIVITVHDVNSFHKKANNFVESLCYKLCDGVIVHNNASFSEIKNTEALKKPISIIPHGNYLPFIDSHPKELNSKYFTFLFFGQIKKVKGLDILLHAISILKDNTSIPFKLVIAGKAWKSDLEEYENLIDFYGIREFVDTNFYYIPDDQVAKFYSKADVVILPYREIYQSGVLLLTMSYGTPLLCSDLKPFMEFINHGDTGLVFKDGDAFDLSDKLLKIVNQEYNLSNISKNANQLISHHFDWNNIGRQTNSFYKSII